MRRAQWWTSLLLVGGLDGIISDVVIVVYISQSSLHDSMLVFYRRKYHNSCDTLTCIVMPVLHVNSNPC